MTSPGLFLMEVKVETSAMARVKALAPEAALTSNYPIAIF
jgi:hypothetical protein